MFLLFEAFGTHVDMFPDPRLPTVEGLEGDREGDYVAHRWCYILVSLMDGGWSNSGNISYGYCLCSVGFTRPSNLFPKFYASYKRSFLCRFLDGRW